MMVLVIMQFGTNGLKKIDPAWEMPDMRHFGYTEAFLYDLLSRIGAAGRSLYTRQLGIDFLFAIVYALFKCVMTSTLMKRANVDARFRILNLLPILRSVLDIFENCFLMAVIYQFPSQLPVLVGTASMLTFLKWGVNTINMAVMFILGASLSMKSMKIGKLTMKASKTI